MRAARTVATRQIDLIDLPAPTATEGTTLIAVDSIGLCGTDHHIWLGRYPPSQVPLVQGHETAGILLEAPGDRFLEAHIGERVVVDPTNSCGVCFACRRRESQVCDRMQVLGVHRDGGLCELLQVPTSRIHLVGDLPSDLAVLVEPASISVEAVRRADPQTGDLVVVVGAGPIGLWAITGLVDKGARVAVIEPNSWRRTLAVTAGAELALSGALTEDRLTLSEWAGEDGPRLLIEASGAPGAFRICLELVRNAGVIVVVGVANHETALSIATIPYKGLDIRGSRNSQTSLTDVAHFVSRHQSLAHALITHRYPLEQIDQAFAVMDGIDVDSQIGKVIVQVR